MPESIADVFKNISKKHIYDGVKRGFLYSFESSNETKKLFVFEYNPPKYDENESIDYQIIQVPGRNYPIIIYGSGKERTINFQLLTTGNRLGENENEKQRTIDQWLNEFYDLMRPQGQYGRPPACYFGWGEYIVKCVITSVKIDRELFDENLNIKRLWLDVELLLIESGEQEIKVKEIKATK